MCSIAGGLNGVGKMLEVMEHRSPDGMGVFVDDGKFEIGMGRLAVIDLEPIPLPFRYGDLVLAYNGEVYNYKEIRSELEGLGYIFKTRGDTEVVAYAYEEWGDKCLDRFNGMFAFAVYDVSRETVFLARDIAGEKPLYYTERHFAFASENKALGFRGVELPPAHCATYDLKTKTLFVKQWWTFEPWDLDGLSESDLEFQLENLIKDSIMLRTQSDVPYGLFLSGGVDSTLIETFHDFDHTFTYVDKDYEQEFKEIFPKILWHLDAPIDSFSPFGLWKLNEQAHRAGVKVVLSGEGADELFGGYVRYVPNALNYAAQKEFPSYQGMFPYHGDLGWKDFNGKMRGLLRMGDRMSSAWGIENRCPFLDRRIIEFAFSLPPELKAYGFDTKIILKRILQRRFPNYVEQEKHGLFCSVNEWLGEANRLSKDAYLAYQNKLWQKYQSS